MPIINEERKTTTVLERHTRTFLRDKNGKVIYAKKERRKIMVLEAKDGELFITYSPSLYDKFQVGDKVDIFVRYYPMPDGRTLSYVTSYKPKEINTKPKLKKKTR